VITASIADSTAADLKESGDMVAGAMAIGKVGGSLAATMEPDGDCPALERAAIARPSAAAGLAFPIERSGLMILRAVMFWQPFFRRGQKSNFILDR
jgi:hypothetical protein